MAGTTAARPRLRPKPNFLILKQYKQHKCISKLSARFAVDWCVALGGGSKKSSRSLALARGDRKSRPLRGPKGCLAVRTGYALALAYTGKAPT